MNVLMILTWCTPKGAKDLEAGVFHYEQAKALEQYCNVAMYYPFDQQIEYDVTKENEWGVLTYRSRFRIGAMHVLQNKKQICQAMKQIIQEFRPDIIHAHCAAGAGHYAVSYGKKYHIPVVITEHSPIELSGVGHFGRSYLLSGKAYKNSKANICVSRDSQKKLSSRYPHCSFEVIYNGITPPKYGDIQKKCYREGYLNIVIVAILYDLEIKGMKYLLQAMEMLKKQGRKVMLHHIGAGEYLGYFQDMARELDIADICRFHGKCNRERVYEIVNEMDFLVSASLVESGGVCVQEAMLLGKPVLGTNSGGVDSLVPEKAGIIVEKANAQALADGIIKMWAKLDSYNRDWIKKYAYETFEIDHISQKYMSLYKRIVEDR